MDGRAEDLRALVPWNRDWLKPLRSRLLRDLVLERSSLVVTIGPGEPCVLAHDDGSVDAVVCEHVLMWTEVPERVIADVHRVLRPGGHLVVAAEPDFGGVLEHPDGAGIQGLVAGVLRKHGADPDVGRRLVSLFTRDRFSTEVHLHQPGPQASPAGEMLELMIRRVRLVLEGEVQPRVVDYWEREVRSASGLGTFFTWVPHFALVARKL